jgi:predicted Abi (CAAX) family protease
MDSWRGERRRPFEFAGKVRTAFALPPNSAWRQLAIEAAWSLPLAALLCAVGGLIDPGWTDRPGQLLRLALVTLVAPALGEELLFRVLLLPAPGTPASGRRLALSVLLFVLWHPPQALIFGPHWAVIVLNPGFLTAVAVLGLALGRLYLCTGLISRVLPRPHRHPKAFFVHRRLVSA